MSAEREKIVIAVAATLLALPAAAQENFTTWVNGRVEAIKRETVDRAKVAISVRSNTNQDEAPSVSANTSSLVDTSSASDLVGIALNIAGMQGSTEGSDSGTDATTAAATVSTYALYSAIVAEDPLDPVRYCDEAAQWARKLSFTLGYDDGKTTSTTNGGTSTNPIIGGVKFLAWNGRNVCDEGAFDRVTDALKPAAARFAGISQKVEDRFYGIYTVARTDLPAAVRAQADQALADARSRALSANPPRDPDTAEKVAFLNLLNDPTFFAAYLAALGGQAAQVVTDEVDRQGIEPFIQLDKTAAEAIEEFRMAPQVAFSFLTTQRPDGNDDYRGEAIVDIGLVRRLNLTANGSYEGSRGGTAGASNGGRIAAQLQFQPLPESLVGPKTLRLNLGFEGAWATEMKPTYKGQFKVNLPIPRVMALSGFELPLSVTVANRSELIDETEVQGLVGFTLDTAQLLAALPNVF